MTVRAPCKVWSWIVLVAALVAGALFLWATERRYFEYADWTRGVSASIESADVSPKGEAGTLGMVLDLASPGVGFETAVDRVEFALMREGKHVGYFYTLPGEMAVEPRPGAEGGRRITVTKDVAREIAAELFGCALPGVEAVDGSVRVAGSVVIRVALARGEKLARVPIAGEVMKREVE